MLSLRAFTRAVPRTFSRSIATSVARPLRPSPVSFQSSLKLASRPAYAAFSTSIPRFESPGQTDPELAAKFQDELSLESQSADGEQLPESVQNFLDNSPFELKDTAGEEEVVMTRKFGDEDVRVTFTIADLQSISPEDQLGNNESGMSDEGGEKSENQQQDPENMLSDDTEAGYPVRINVTIGKANKGAMHVETIAHNAEIQIENVSYFNQGDLANASSAEKEWTRQTLYAGPPFGNLDEALQDLLEGYLRERGIDESLALFAPEYIDFKEQKEYVRWLGNLKKFVEA